MTGRTALPPSWALGHQQSRWSYPDAERVREIAREFRSRKIPCDAVVLDIDYMDEFRTFTVSPERFPKFDRLVDELAADNFKVVTIVDPGIKQDPDYAVFADGVECGAFCRTVGNELFVDEVWPGDAVFPDFLNQAARDWWARKVQFYADCNIAGLWLDMNEPAFFSKKQVLGKSTDELPPNDQQYFVQQTHIGPVGHLEVRNLYGLLMSMATHAALLRYRKNERPFLLSRSGYAGIQRYAAVWLGDNMSWFQHLAKSVPMLLNMGMSGVPFVGVDVGGFGGDTTAELLVRWYELGIFYPFLRNHCIMNGRAQEPWAFSQSVESAIRRLLVTRYQLLPYIRGLFWEHWRSGAPLMRPMLWHYPDDGNVLELDDQFMFGDKIMVAPVIEAGKTGRNVYFPEGRWHPFAGGPAIDGPCLKRLEMPLGSVPAFVADGSIIPLAAPTESSAQAAHADITFTVFGDNAKGKYFEDDGATTAYEAGGYNEWDLTFADDDLSITRCHSGFIMHRIQYYLQDGHGKVMLLQP